MGDVPVSLFSQLSAILLDSVWVVYAGLWVHIPPPATGSPAPALSKAWHARATAAVGSVLSVKFVSTLAMPPYHCCWCQRFTRREKPRIGKPAQRERNIRDVHHCGATRAPRTPHTLKNETHALENDILLASLFLGGADWVNHRRALLNRGDMHLCPDIHACHVLIHFKCLVILP